MRFEFDMPFWRSLAVTEEPLLMMEQQDGGFNGFLMCEPEEPPVLRDAYGAEYAEGVDYRVRGAEVIRLPGSRMPVLMREEYMPTGPRNPSAPYRMGGGLILYMEDRFLVDRQVYAAYRFREPVRRFVSDRHGAKRLAGLCARLAARQPVRIALLGDSLGEGCNCSAMLNKYPFAPPWYTRFVMGLIQRYHAPVEMPTGWNLSKGGELSEYGVRRAEEAAALSPDLLIVEFGNNDGTFHVTPEKFIQNIRLILDTVLCANPGCAFILCTPMVTNPDAIQSGNQLEYLAPLLALEAEYETAVVADFTTPHQAMFAGGKRASDLSANNINHPNDFVIQAITDVLLELF